MITSPANPKIQYVRALARRRTRHQEKQFIIEGVRLVEEALRADIIPALSFFTEDLVATERGRNLLAELQKRGASPLPVSNAVMRTMSDAQTPQGILAVVPFPQPVPPPTLSLILVVDGIRDPGNLGTLLRTAEAAGVEEVLLAPGTVDLYNPKVVRGAMGAHFRLPIKAQDWAEIASITSGTQVFLADARGDREYDKVDWCAPSTLIVGGEAEGASASGRKLATIRVFIPMQGSTESLNVAVAAAVILFEAARQRRRMSLT
ncbi:MAG: RNA methyltransferase [Anaerolineae bacterium]|nr:RNA methyltransferase [Anaerolineae bacterium]MDH7475602.1 RNA methyltransferase [Anaerolineae bacterium]